MENDTEIFRAALKDVANYRGATVGRTAFGMGEIAKDALDFATARERLREMEGSDV